mmetsp:Transcript_18449/g.27878  ORF Transcript_18449/g.27878 Transcript_18449/m.27878 type:complete len:418 (-) Transcript_18449:9-1262(-)
MHLQTSSSHIMRQTKFSCDEKVCNVSNVPSKKNSRVRLFPSPLQVGQTKSMCSIDGINDENKACERWQWKVNNYVDYVPSYYCLEKSTIRVRSIGADVVSSRISSFLRLNSIATKYERTYVECDTSQFLTFVVHLWKGDQEDETIVEVQRRNGCILQFRHIRKNIYGAITSCKTEAASQGPKSINETPYRMTWVTKNGGSQKKHAKQIKNACLMELLRAEQMIQSNYHDQKLFGMEDIARIVRPSNKERIISSAIAKSLVCGTERGMDFLRPTLGEYFYDTKIDESGKGGGYARGWNFGKLHFIALKVLKNALEVVFLLKRNKDQDLTIDVHSFFWRNCFDALIYDVEVAPKRPLEASISISCLCLAFSIEPELKFHRLVKERLMPKIAIAKKFGKNYHLNLETASKNLSDLFQAYA